MLLHCGMTKTICTTDIKTRREHLVSGRSRLRLPCGVIVGHCIRPSDAYDRPACWSRCCASFKGCMYRTPASRGSENAIATYQQAGRQAESKRNGTESCDPGQTIEGNE